MTKFPALTALTAAVLFAACTSTSPPDVSDKITRLEAKQLACPKSVLDAGASRDDCSCVENKLFEIGQKPGAIQYDNSAIQTGIGDAQGKREIAIGILRLDAFEHCGLFDPNHIVSRNLQSPS